MGAGADWKIRREAMGKSLDDASLELRISKKYLRGIEEGNYSRWPAKVFSAGFIRAYANFLSVDPEPVLSEYYSFLGMQKVAEPQLPTRPEWLERERLRGSRRTAYASAAGVVLALGIILFWYGRHTAVVPPPGPAVKEPSPPSPVASGAPATGAAPAAGPGGSDNAASGTSPVPVQQTVTAVGGSGPIKAPYQLFLEASDLTWVMYGRDGSEPVDVMLYPGDRLSIQAQNKIYLKLGNAGGVVGTLNGRPLPSFGEKGQVKETTFGE